VSRSRSRRSLFFGVAFVVLAGVLVFVACGTKDNRSKISTTRAREKLDAGLQAKLDREHLRGRRGADAAVDRSKDSDAVIERFAEKEPEPPVPAPPAPPPGPPPSTHVALLATYVTDEAGEGYATFIDRATGVGGMYEIGDRVPNAGTLVAVGPTTAVVSDASGAYHTIDLEIGSSAASPAPKAASRGDDDAIPTGPQTVSKAELTQAAANPKQIGARTRIGKDGRITIASVRRGTRAHQLGFRKGDVLVSVAGVKLTSPDSALEAMNKVKSSSQAAVVIERGGQAITLHFNLTE
jgi:hypothetical protein